MASPYTTKAHMTTTEMVRATDSSVYRIYYTVVGVCSVDALVVFVRRQMTLLRWL